MFLEKCYNICMNTTNLDLILNNIIQLLPFLGIILFINTVIFCFACYKKDNSIADIFYSYGFVLSAFTAIIFSQNITWIKILTFTFILIWGKRLFWRIYLKNRNKSEDFRYAKWRAQWLQKGKLYFCVRSYLQVFVLQGIIAFIIMLPALYLLSSDVILDLQNIYFFVLGISLWIIGFIFESVGDKQLDNFLKDKIRLAQEKIMTTGLWKYTRHPNYFGELCIWWGIFFIMLGYFNNISALFLIISPMLITYLLMYVSGVPMLEKRWDEDTNPEVKSKWQEYKKITPVILPKFWNNNK